MPKNVASLLILVVSLLAAASAPSADAPSSSRTNRAPRFADLFGDEVLARGKGIEVRRSHLDEAFVAYTANLAGRGQSIPEIRRTAQEAQLLQRLVVTQILTNRLSDEDRRVATGL